VSIEADRTPPPAAVPKAACSVGRWITRDGWPGWQAECGEPGTECQVPPYVLCGWHAWDLAVRYAQRRVS